MDPLEQGVLRPVAVPDPAAAFPGAGWEAEEAAALPGLRGKQRSPAPSPAPEVTQGLGPAPGADSGTGNKPWDTGDS